MSRSGDAVFVCFDAVVILYYVINRGSFSIFYFRYLSVYSTSTVQITTVYYTGVHIQGNSQRKSEEFHPGFNLAESQTLSDNLKRCYDVAHIQYIWGFVFVFHKVSV